MSVRILAAATVSAEMHQLDSGERTGQVQRVMMMRQHSAGQQHNHCRRQQIERYCTHSQKHHLQCFIVIGPLLLHVIVDKSAGVCAEVEPTSYYSVPLFLCKR